MDLSGRHALLLDQAQDKVAVLDADGAFTYVNEAAERILGFDQEALVGANAFDYVHPEDVAEVRDAFYRTVRNDGFCEERISYRHRAADGDWVWLESRMSNLSDGVLEGYVVSSRDVTDRVEAERERAETANRFEDIAGAASDVLWMFNGDWSELLFVNPAYEEIYGASIEAVRSDPSTFLDTIHPDDVPVVKDAMARLSEGQSVNMEYRVNPAEQYKRWVWVQAEPIVQDGEVTRITGFTRDITDRRRRERQLVVMDNLLRHNLRNDLNVILGRADLIDGKTPEAAEHTAVIRRVGEQLLRSADKARDVTDLITSQSGRERVALRERVCDGVETVRERHPEGALEVGELAAVHVNGRPELELAVIELLENAFQHSDADEPRVRLELRRVGEHAELVVEDDQPPIPEIEADVLTGEHDTTNVYHSSGLGFWLVYWAVELSNGHITVNNHGRGNRITVTLPLAAVDGARAE